MYDVRSSSSIFLVLISFTAICFAAGDPIFVDRDLYEGSACNLRNGQSGICREITNCPAIMNDLMKNGRNSSTKSCGFKDFTEIVCCPERRSQLACKKLESEDVFHTVVVHGEPAEHAEFKYVVALGYENQDADRNTVPIKYQCGGTLISVEHVLTAAHCVTNVQGAVPVTVRLGTTNLKNVSSYTQDVRISKIIKHPKYKRSTNYNDVAILKLEKAVEKTDAVRPICLPQTDLHDRSSIPDGSFTVIGWGSTEFENEGSDKLMKARDLSYVDRNTCSESFQGFRQLPHGLDNSLICIVDRNISRLADACTGDSGGPLVMRIEYGEVLVVGITAFGQACGSIVPGVYTSIYPFLDWIEDQVWPSKPMAELKYNIDVRYNFTGK